MCKNVHTNAIFGGLPFGLGCGALDMVCGGPRVAGSAPCVACGTRCVVVVDVVVLKYKMGKGSSTFGTGVPCLSTVAMRGAGGVGCMVSRAGVAGVERT